MNRDELNVIISNAVNKFLDKNSGNHLDELDVQNNINVEVDGTYGTIKSNELSIEIKYFQK